MAEYSNIEVFSFVKSSCRQEIHASARTELESVTEQKSKKKDQALLDPARSPYIVVPWASKMPALWLSPY